MGRREESVVFRLSLLLFLRHTECVKPASWANTSNEQTKCERMIGKGRRCGRQAM
jgi:hypothetical protein